MKILLLAVNSAWTHSNLALLYLRELIPKDRYQTELLEVTIKHQILEVLQLVHKSAPEIVCISVYIWNRLYVQRLVPELSKLLPELKLVLGGPEALHPELQKILRPIDITVKGYGEAAFKACLESGFCESGIIQSEDHLCLDQIPFVYQIDDHQRFKGRLLYYETSRGCPYSCIYCLSATDKRNEIRFDPGLKSDLERLYREIDILVAMEPKTVKFVDRSFNLYPELAHAIWSYVFTLDCKCDFHFEIYPELLQEKDLLLLEKAPENRIRFEIGIQSTNDSVMANVHRRSDWQKTKPVLSELRSRTKIRIHSDLICGLPSETRESIIRSINELASTNPHEIQLGMLKILPDTPMQEIADKLGYKYLSHPPYQVLASDTLDFDDICHFDDLGHIIGLYWNKNEFCNVFELWQKVISSYDIFCAILEMHHSRDYPLHSIEQRKRFLLIRDLIGIHSMPDEYYGALMRDWENLGSRTPPDFLDKAVERV